MKNAAPAAIPTIAPTDIFLLLSEGGSKSGTVKHKKLKNAPLFETLKKCD